MTEIPLENCNRTTFAVYPVEISKQTYNLLVLFCKVTIDYTIIHCSFFRANKISIQASTVERRYSGHTTIQWATPLVPKPTVFMKNDINRYPNYNKKLLVQFFMKLLRFLAKPEKTRFHAKASKQCQPPSSLFNPGKRLNLRSLFLAPF